MFTAPRFVAIDDKEEHLAAIINTFQLMGSPCQGILYDAAKPPEANLFRSVRVLFIDLHLLEGVKTTEETRHFAQIAQILEDNIAKTGGPFVLVIWTQYPRHCPELRAYLDANLDPALPHVRPLEVLCLEKERFLNLESGNVQQPNALKVAVQDAVTQNAQLAAMLSWETDVLGAAGATLAALLELVGTDARRGGGYAASLDGLLSRLAVAAVGKGNVPADKRAAINSVLGPILADRIQNQPSDAELLALWRRAITRDQEKLADLNPVDAGLVNRMLHVALPASEIIRAADWGAVVEFPDAWKADAEMTQRFSVPLKEILGGDLKISRADRDRCRLRLVRVGAVCDYAQRRKGPIPFIFAAEVPTDIDRPKETRQAAEWESPTFTLDAADSFRLVAHSRYLTTLTENAVQGFPVRYRLREQILMQLINHAGQYGTRPGIVMV